MGDRSVHPRATVKPECDGAGSQRNTKKTTGRKIMDTQVNLPALGSMQRNGLIVAVIGILGCIVGGILDPARFFASYLFAYVFWTSFSLGFLGIVMLHHMTSGRWSFLIERISEAGMRVLPLQALLFIPLLFGMGYLYPWITHAGEPAMLVRAAYL